MSQRLCWGSMRCLKLVLGLVLDPSVGLGLELVLGQGLYQGLGLCAGPALL